MAPTVGLADAFLPYDTDPSASLAACSGLGRDDAGGFCPRGRGPGAPSRSPPGQQARAAEPPGRRALDAARRPI
jgi:hypothetical protein